MIDTTLIRDAVKAVAMGDKDEAERLEAKIPDGERAHFAALLDAVFHSVITLQFEGEQSHRAIEQFVDEMQYDYREVQPPIRSHLIAEVLKSHLGDGHLLSTISSADQLRYQIPILRRIVRQSAPIQARLDDCVDDAERHLARSAVAATR